MKCGPSYLEINSNKNIDTNYNRQLQKPERQTYAAAAGALKEV